MLSSFSQSSGVRFMTAIMESRRFVADHSAVVEEKVTIATTLEEVEALRDVWKSLPVDDIDSDIDYYMTVVRHADQVIRPHVVHIRQDGGADLLAVARLENLPVPFRFGYRRLGSTTLRAIVVTFGGILGARNKYEEEVVLRHLMKDLDKGVADLILMRNVDVDSTLYATALAATGWARRAHAQPVSRRWMAVIPDSMERFLETRSAKTRGNLRRHDNQLRTEYAGRLELRHLDHPEDATELFRDMEAVAAKTYQRGLGVGFSGTPMQCALVKLGLDRGWYRTWMLYIDDRPVAFWSGFGYGGTFQIGTPGFDPDMSKLSIGRFTMLRMLEDLCADPAISELDFGHGEAEYKSSFGRAVRSESEVMLAASRPWPTLVMLAVSSLSFANNLVRRLVENSEWGRRLKAGWRRRMAGK